MHYINTSCIIYKYKILHKIKHALNLQLLCVTLKCGGQLKPLGQQWALTLTPHRKS